MAHRVVRRGGFSRGKRRETEWLEVEQSITTLAASGGTLTHSLTTAELAKRPFTLIRSILHYSLGSDQLAASELQVVAAGLAVVSTQAVAIGVTAVPTPVTDAASDLWLMHRWMSSDLSFADATGFANTVSLFDVDSRAMRKVEDGQDLVHVLELSTGAGSSGASVLTMGRLLIKVH